MHHASSYRLAIKHWTGHADHSSGFNIKSLAVLHNQGWPLRGVVTVVSTSRWKNSIHDQAQEAVDCLFTILQRNICGAASSSRAKLVTPLLEIQTFAGQYQMINEFSHFRSFMSLVSAPSLFCAWACCKLATAIDIGSSFGFCCYHASIQALKAFLS